MKALLALAAILITSTSFAISSNDSWSEIKSAVKANHKLTISHMPVFIGRPISAFDACVEGDMFKTTRKFAITERQYVGKHKDTDGDNDGYMNVVVDHKILSYPMVYVATKSVCRPQGNNCKTVEYIVEQSDVKEIPVKKIVRVKQGERIYKTLFTKEYQIPACN